MKRHLTICTMIVSLMLSFGMTSCTSMLTGLYGVKEIKLVNEKIIAKNAKRFNIPMADNYELDTAYLTYLVSLDTSKYKLQIKNHYQPLQALYYDNAGYLKSFQVNCYAGGYPNLKWERDEIMTTFPPKQQAPVDSLVSLQTQLKFLKPLSTTAKFSIENYNYIVIVFWNRFMGRQSKRFVRFIQENSKLETTKKVKIIYVNNDNVFVGL